MSNQYLRAFVIGSSFFVFIPYFLIVSSFDKKNINFSYEYYTFVAPIALGIFNVLSLYLANIFNLTKRTRFVVISLIAPTLVAATVYILKVYNNLNTYRSWFNYLIKLYLLYFFVFSYDVYLLDRYV
uniref:Uncharacterized protein n=1 Tax=viral metagenome TaxID=1070528 RepID=A0A6C0KRU0_9ZZZZ